MVHFVKRFLCIYTGSLKLNVWISIFFFVVVVLNKIKKNKDKNVGFFFSNYIILNNFFFSLTKNLDYDYFTNPIIKSVKDVI